MRLVCYLFGIRERVFLSFVMLVQINSFKGVITSLPYLMFLNFKKKWFNLFVRALNQVWIKKFSNIDIVICLINRICKIFIILMKNQIKSC